MLPLNACNINKKMESGRCEREKWKAEKRLLKAALMRVEFS